MMHGRWEQYARYTYYLFALLFTFTFWYMLLFKPQTINQWITTIIVVVILHLLKHLYNLGFQKFKNGGAK